MPDDPPVLAGISTGHKLGRTETEPGQIIIAFWGRSEVEPKVWDEGEVVDLGGIKFLFAVLREYRPMFENSVIDYTPERAFFLRQLGHVATNPVSV